MSPALPSALKDVVIPVVVALLPFAPGVYTKLTEPTLHFAYQVRNERNPIEEWNRQLERMFKRLEPQERKDAENLAAPLLRKIGSEIYQSLPALLAGAGIRPADTSTVTILNVADHELKNIRVHFIGCEGFDSYQSWPDSIGSPSNPGQSSSKPTGQVTLRYDKIPPSVNRVESQAMLRFFGDRTSDCKPTVEAETPDGRPAIGKLVNIDDYRNEAAWERYGREQRTDFFFKLFLAIGLVYVYLLVRGLRKRLLPEG